MALEKAVLPSNGKPLSWMQSLGPAVSYFEPPVADAASDDDTGRLKDPEPELIVMLTWMAARDVHIAKYVNHYRIMFPTSRILVVRSTWVNVLLPFLKTRDYAPTLPIIRSVINSANRGDDPDKRPRTLLHVFSNGGVSSAVALYRMLGGPAFIPRHVLVMDSCPGYFHWRMVHRALSQPLPRVVSPMVHVLMAILWTLYKALRWPLTPDGNAVAISAADLAKCETRRTYIYGTADDMVTWQDIEDHAAKAKAKGFVVRTERFEGGKHVLHVRIDLDRYWRVVRETWEER